MPPTVVKKWAKEQGFTNKEAERRWRKAKLLATREGRNPEITDQKDDWKYVMGIYKTMMHKRDKPKVAEHLIAQVADGQNPRHAIDIILSRLSESSMCYENVLSVGADFRSGETIQTFFDGSGRLRFHNEDNVLINPMSDYRLLELAQYADVLDVDNPLFDLFESYEGTLENLYKKVTDAFSLVTQME